MKNKAPLALMEQLIMLLVFALAAALCLQVFVFSGRVSRRSEAQSHAATAVQNTAELLKATHGQAAFLPRPLGSFATEDGWYIPYDETWNPTADHENAAYYVFISPADTGVASLGGADVSAHSKTEELFRITVYWEEVMIFHAEAE